jgi:carbonic anhydrase
MEGIHRFQSEAFGEYAELFARLAREGQNPHTLFITCADSRVLAELITQSKPGDLFVVKNVGNIIPPNDVKGSTNSTAAAIEFAVKVLKIEDIVVCGHSQCGAMHALLQQPPELAEMGHVRRWLEIAAPVRETVEKHYTHLEAQERANAAAEENVLYALENLQTYPCIQESLAKGTLLLHGWFFEIATAKLFAYDNASRQFQPLVRAGQAS